MPDEMPFILGYEKNATDVSVISIDIERRLRISGCTDGALPLHFACLPFPFIIHLIVYQWCLNLIEE
jgi:hypothetical protein